MPKTIVKDLCAHLSTRIHTICSDSLSVMQAAGLSEEEIVSAIGSTIFVEAITLLRVTGISESQAIAWVHRIYQHQQKRQQHDS